jgi:hypothetical protein
MLHRPLRRVVGILSLAVFMMLSLAATAQELPPGGTFVDDDGNTHEGYIEAIADLGVTRGCNPPDNDRYCPLDPVTRGQMAAFINRALGLESADEDHFVDDDSSTFENDINALAAADITRGCNPPDNDEFCPDEFVTRGQMAALLVRGFGYGEDPPGDRFVDDDGSIFENDIERLAEAGVTLGCNPPDNDRFCPSALVQRDQMASFLGRALELAPHTPPPVMVVAPYLFVAEDGHTGRTGPFVVPMARRVSETVAIAESSLDALLEGPTSAEMSFIPALSTEIPSGTELNSVTITDGVATVDLSGEFAAEEATSSAAMRAAQVVFTLTRFDTVDSVDFRQDGVDVEVRTDNAGMVDRPVTRDDYRDFQAAVSVENPLYGGASADSLVVTGEALVFEATFQFALTDDDGRTLEEGTAMSSSGSTWAPFDFTIDYDVTRSQMGALIVWVGSPRDGTRIDIREYPVWLQP